MLPQQISSSIPNLLKKILPLTQKERLVIHSSKMLNCLNPELKMKNYLTQVKPNKRELIKVIHNH